VAIFGTGGVNLGCCAGPPPEDCEYFFPPLYMFRFHERHGAFATKNDSKQLPRRCSRYQSIVDCKAAAVAQRPWRERGWREGRLSGGMRALSRPSAIFDFLIFAASRVTQLNLWLWPRSSNFRLSAHTHPLVNSETFPFFWCC